jgi:deoxyribonuclease V
VRRSGRALSQDRRRPAAAVLAADAAFTHVLAERTALIPWVSPYRPGEFYLRELPPLRAVLDDLSELGLLVVNGYGDLDPSGRPGLGAHAHAESGIPVIGVAKSRFRTATHAVTVVRGDARSRRGGPGPAYGRPVPAA